MDLDSGEKSDVTLHEGQGVVIYTNCAHRFIAEKDAQVIEYYDCRYDPEDDVPYDGF